ncbi:major facilitator superfamily domain-containing protein [Mycena rebaudengoi]|nr:major facilitator superfamily domain-containing protein [Mycena rebaudengoi]
MRTVKSFPDKFDSCQPLVHSMGTRCPRFQHAPSSLELEKAALKTTSAEFVEGGLRGWLAVLGGQVDNIYLVARRLHTTFGNIQRDFLSNESASTVSWIGSIQLALQFMVGVASGRLFDKGYFHVVMISGTVLLLFSSFMLSLAKPHHLYQVLLSQGFGMGIGGGLLFLPSLGIVPHYFRRRRAVAMGIMISSGSFGGVIYSILLNKIIARENLGFAWAVRFVALINLVLLVVANLIMKPRPLNRTAEPVDMKQILHDGPYWITTIGLFLGFWGIFVPYFYLQLFSFQQGVDASFLTWVIPILNAGATFGRVMPSFLADRYGPLNVIIPCGIISGAIVWALLGVSSVAGVTIFALCYGFVSGAFLSLASPALAAFSTSPTMNDVGLRIGIACLFMGLALLSGNPIAGALLSPPSYIWSRPLIFACVSFPKLVPYICTFPKYLFSRR